MNKSIFYFASKSNNLRYIKPKSQISFWPHLVHNLNLYYLQTGQKWKNEDLLQDYYLTPVIKFKQNRTPYGVPFLYSGIIEKEEIIIEKDYPYLFQNKYSINIRKLNSAQQNMLLDLSESLQESFFMDKKK